MRKIDIISTVVRRSLTGEKIPSGNTIVFEGGNIDIDSILDKLSVEMRDKYLSKTTDDEALGLINFKQGLKIGGVELKYDQDNNAVFIERADGVPVNFYVTGGMAMYGLGNTKVTSILDAIEENLDPNTLGIVNGKLTVIGGGSGGEGGITTVTKQMVIDALGFTPYSADNPNGYITAASIPSALKNPYALTFGSKTYDGSAAKEITASDLGAALSSDLAKYLPLTGGTVNGIVNLNYNLGASSYIRLTNNQTKESSGWAVSMYDFRNHENVSMARLGAFGGANTLSYLHLGHHEYDGNNLRIYTDKVTFGINTIWHAGNDGSGSGLDADKLDGKHISEISKYIFTNGTAYALAADSDLDTVGCGYYTSNDNIVYPHAPVTNFGLLTVNLNGAYKGQIVFPYGSNYEHIRFRSQVYENGIIWKGWRKLAYIDDNVASAAKLQTARKIWGQNFDGTGDVTGNFYMGNNININGADTSGNYHSLVHLNNNNVLYFGYGTTTAGYRTIIEGNDIYFRYKGHTVGMVMSDLGNVGMGTTSPLSKCHIAHTNWDNGLILQRTASGAGAGIKFMDSASMLGIIGINGTKTLEVNLSKDGSTNVNRLTISNTGTMSVNSDNAGVIVIKRIIANGGAFVDYHSNNASVRDWRVGSNSYGNFTFNSFSSNTETERITFTKSGNVGFGAPNPSAKLHVNGNILATGGVTMQSQRSLKNVVDERGLSLTELSEIKPTRYTWKDKRDDRVHIGGIADDIEKVLPEVIYKTSDGTLTMDYGNAGFAVASSLIKPVVDHEARIAALEKENKELKEQLNRLSA